MCAKLKVIREDLWKRRHLPVPVQRKWIGAVVRGYFAYHAIPTNLRSMCSFRVEVTRSWLHALRRRSQRSRVTWQRMQHLANHWIPSARVLHPCPWDRPLRRSNPRQEPSALAAHARICAGAARVTYEGRPYRDPRRSWSACSKDRGREWQPEGEPDLVDEHDFPQDAIGKAIPYGDYDIAANDGFVGIGTDHDTSVFAVTSIESWWKQVSSQRYRNTRETLIHRRRWWQRWLPLVRLEKRVAAPGGQARPRDPR
jgi:hypothetical protein